MCIKGLGNKDAYAIVVMDANDLKMINDTYGHNAGDYVLQRMAELLKEGNENTYVCRWGGEEFLVLLQGHLVDDGVFEALRRKIEKADFSFEGKQIRVTMTVGVAYRAKEETIDRWIQRADEKLYFGKEHGRNQVAM